MNRVLCIGLSVALVIVAAGTAVRLVPHPALSTYAPASTAVYASGGELLRLTLAADDQYRLWTPLSEVSPEYLDAVLFHEDRNFRRHPGVDPFALLRAAVRTGTGEGRQGGSTISMQLARLIYRVNTRSIAGKLRQMAVATWLELCYSKDEILEAYVNLAPFGGNIQGVGAASRIYFDKSARQLTFAEALALALIPQSPQARAPEDGESESLLAARRRLAKRWLEKHAASPDAIAAAVQPLHFRELKELPFLAPHLVASVLAEADAGTEIRTTLDLSLQRQLERSVRQYIAAQKPLGVTNAAALLIDSRSLEVKALVGSADFFDPEIAGQVNGVTAKRSPGSALKPFIYALAIDQGLIHTHSVLKDAPAAFGSYAPENFDGVFSGPVSAHDALIASRNIPAVGLVSKLTAPGLYQFLQSAGVSRMKSERHYGLALALGGGEVTMEELVSLYAMLANGGTWGPLEYTPGAPRKARTRLVSENAAFMVLSILEDSPRPDHAPNARPRVAWKTGTSWGFRDAWSVGVVGPYVLAVWVGNFDGSSNQAFVGARAAAPLFFRMVDGLRASQPMLASAAEYPPPGVEQVEVCAASGDLPNADCPRLAKAWFIPGKSPIRVSTVHRRVAVDIRTGTRACPETPPGFVRTELFEYWSSDILQLYAQAGMPRRPVPADSCAGNSGQAALAPPAIVSPVYGATYQLRTSRISEQLELSATADSGIRSLYWFADGAFVGTSRPSSPLAWNPGRTGEIALSVVDDHGGSAARTIRIAAIP